MKKVGLYIIIAAAVLALIVWKLNSNKKENAEKANIVKQSSSGAVPVLCKPQHLPLSSLSLPPMETLKP